MLKEFFHDEKQKMSMSKLLLFMSFFPATFVLIHTPTDSMFSGYLYAYALSYAVGKGLPILNNFLGDTKNARISRK
jgi:hypothetical protein